MVGELGGRVDGAREEALAERAERDEPDAELLECGQDLFLGTLPPQRVLALHRSNWKHGVGPADRAGSRFGEPPVLHLAGFAQLLDGAGDLFDRDVGVDTVLVVEVDRVDAEPS